MQQMLRYGDVKAKVNRHSLRINTYSTSTPLYFCNFYRQHRFYDFKAHRTFLCIRATVLALHLSALTTLSEEKQQSAATFQTHIMENGIGSR